jgi:PII-like signaling protein
MLFETEGLEYASPATVSRCGMVFLEERGLTGEAVMRRHTAGLPVVLKMQGIEIRIEAMLDTIMKSIRVQDKHHLIKVKPNSLIENLMKVFECYCAPYR